MQKYVRFIAYEVLPYLTSANKKPLRQQARELLALKKKYSCIPYHYFKHRLYERRHNDHFGDYIPPLIIKYFQVKSNPAEKLHMVSNKFETNRLLQAGGIACAGTVLVVDRQGQLQDGATGHALSMPEALEVINRGPQDLFIKPVDGGVGVGAVALSRVDIDETYLQSTRNILIQPRITNHPDLAKLFNKSLNTLRIDTLIEDGKVVFTAACLKVGTGAAHVDNWARGAIALGVDINTGALYPEGLTKAAYGRKFFTSHPDTGQQFAGVTIPFWQDVLKLTERAALALRPHVTLGWDIAVTPLGPVVIEANETGDFFLLQESVGPLGGTRLAQLALALWKAKS